MKSNVKKTDVCYAQPKNLEQRVIIANDFIKRYKYPVPFGIDDMSNQAEGAYSAWPERLYVIDENGKISYKGGNGPFKYDPKEVRAWLLRTLWRSEARRRETHGQQAGRRQAGRQ